jgi:hypothetical protein
MEPKKFALLGRVKNIETIASGKGVRIREYLIEKHGGRSWRKMKGIALVQDSRGNIYEAEIHWYEAHGVGRVDWKIKQPAR